MSKRTLEADVRISLREIAEFVETKEFRSLLSDMYSLPQTKREQFVDSIVLRQSERLKRRVVVPDGMKIQRSTFGDGRPTLFCVSKRLPFHSRQKVTFTFDNNNVPPETFSRS